VGWGTKEAKSCCVKEGFELAEKTVYGRTVSNIQGKEIPMIGAATEKLRDPKPMTRAMMPKIFNRNAYAGLRHSLQRWLLVLLGVSGRDVITIR